MGWTYEKGARWILSLWGLWSTAWTLVLYPFAKQSIARSMLAEENSTWRPISLTASASKRG